MDNDDELEGHTLPPCDSHEMDSADQAEFEKELAERPRCPVCTRPLYRTVPLTHEMLDLDTGKHLKVALAVTWECPCGYEYQEVLTAEPGEPAPEPKVLPDD